MRILIVEDSILMSRIISNILPNNNIEYEIKYNGKEAVDYLLFDNNFDLILMDIEMPIMNGIEATKKINSFLSIPIIVVSSSIELKQYNKLKQIGFSGFISKPINEIELIDIVNKHKKIKFVKNVI